MANNELKPCPMPDCGSTLVGTGKQPCGVATVCCGHCGLSVPGDGSVESAIERWNRAAAPAQGGRDALPDPEIVAMAQALKLPMVPQVGRGEWAYAENVIKFARAIESRLRGRQGGVSDAALLAALTRYEEYGNESGGGLQEAIDGDFVRLDDVLAAIQAQAGDAGGDRG